MRHLLSTKVALVAALLLVFTILPAAPARADDLATEVSSFFADLLAQILASGTDTNAAPLVLVNGATGNEPPSQQESAPQILPHG